MWTLWVCVYTHTHTHFCFGWEITRYAWLLCNTVYNPNHHTPTSSFSHTLNPTLLFFLCYPLLSTLVSSPPASKLTHTMFYFVVYKFLVYTVTNFKTKIILDFYCSQSLPNCIKRSFFLFVSQIFFVNPCNRFIYAKFV